MKTLVIQKSKITYDKNSNTFKGSFDNFPFASEYDLLNAETGKGMKFLFDHSTGSEWDPNTKWIYISTSDPSIKFEVATESNIKQRADAYLKAKMGPINKYRPA